ncbi:hypothetical protein P3L10_019526 [Capsicum annuum]|uniref:uncharacterized protein LOC107875149 n=1 Tax=Capsicum annuum TaxID=4072 RepID=UPI0007BF4D3F|nr:uncharacterized protein LOC107875149 [Capsicum annuum]
MENSQSYGRKIGVLCLFLGMFLLQSCVIAEDRKHPTKNVNLAPFQQWRSAYFCLTNTSPICSKNHTLTMSGWLNVTYDEGKKFCEEGGCADHTKGVLDCIHHVKRDFWFANKATIKHIYKTIHVGCNTPKGFNGTSFYPHTIIYN